MGSNDRVTYHARAAAFMVGAVLMFAIGDTLTKLATQRSDIVPVLFIRAAAGLTIIYIFSFFSKIEIPKRIIYDPLLIARAFLFVATIGLFALGFKYSSFTGFYIVFFVILPCSAFVVDWYIFKKKPAISSILPIALMLCGIIFVHRQNYMDAFQPASIISAATAAAYATYLGFSSYINEKRTYNPLAQVVPNFAYGGFVLLLLSAIAPDSRTNLFEIILSPNSFVGIILAGFFSTSGLILLNRATAYDSAGRIAPYEYTVVIYAVFIDNYLFGVPVTIDLVIGAVVVATGAIWLSKIHQTEPSPRQD